MKKTKHTEEKIIGAVKQMEAGRRRRIWRASLGVTDQTLYNWKAKYGGMEVSDAKKLRALEDENRRLKNGRRSESGQRSTDNGDTKKRLGLVSARRDVTLVMTEHRLSERQACRLLEVDRATYRYEARPDRNAGLREALIALAREKPRLRLSAAVGDSDAAGAGGEHPKPRSSAVPEKALVVRRLKRKRMKGVMPAHPLLAQAESGMGAGLRVATRCQMGRALRALTMVDSFTRECPAIEVDTGISGQQVTRTLERVIEDGQARCTLRCDNGPEFTSRHFLGWCEDKASPVAHSAGQADAERACGKFQRPVPR